MSETVYTMDGEEIEISGPEIELDAEDFLEFSEDDLFQILCRSPSVDIRANHDPGQMSEYDVTVTVDNMPIDSFGHDIHDIMEVIVEEAQALQKGDELVELLKHHIEEDMVEETQQKLESKTFDGIVDAIDEHGYKIIAHSDHIQGSVERDGYLGGKQREQVMSVTVSFIDPSMVLERQAQGWEEALYNLAVSCANNGVLDKFDRIVGHAVKEIMIEDRESPSDIDPTDHLEDFVDSAELHSASQADSGLSADEDAKFEDEEEVNPHEIEVISEAPDVESELDFETRMMRLGNGESDTPDEGMAKVLNYDPDGERVVLSLRLPDSSLGRIEYGVPTEEDEPFVEMVKCAIVERDGMPHPIDLEQIELLNEAEIPVEREDGSWEVAIDHEVDRAERGSANQANSQGLSVYSDAHVDPDNVGEEDDLPLFWFTPIFSPFGKVVLLFTLATVFITVALLEGTPDRVSTVLLALAGILTAYGWTVET